MKHICCAPGQRGLRDSTFRASSIVAFTTAASAAAVVKAATPADAADLHVAGADREVPLAHSACRDGPTEVVPYFSRGTIRAAHKWRCRV